MSSRSLEKLRQVVLDAEMQCKVEDSLREGGALLSRWLEVTVELHVRQADDPRYREISGQE